MVSTAQLLGRIIDVDSHEMMPAKMWPAAYGPVGELAAGLLPANHDVLTLSDWLADVDTDVTPISADTVWRRAGWAGSQAKAPGAIDMARRLDVMDFTGTRRQLVFPSFAFVGLLLATQPPEFIAPVFGADPAAVVGSGEAMGMLGASICRAHNDWAIRQQKIDPDRLRMAGLLLTLDFDELMDEAQRLLAAGVRALVIPPAVPLAGKSPADRSNDPFWALLEEADATVLFHVSLETFMSTDTWRRVPEFEPDTVRSSEFNLDPWSFSTAHYPVENFLTTMILGGVFERHPRLRCGAIEYGSSWVGPMADRLDMWSSRFSRRMSKILSMEPSQYLRQNVRTTAFWFEPVGKYIERYGFDEVYCYGTDYPHVEAGEDHLETHFAHVAGLGESVVEKYFVKNAEFLIPSLPGV